LRGAYPVEHVYPHIRVVGLVTEHVLISAWPNVRAVAYADAKFALVWHDKHIFVTVYKKNP